MPHVDPTRMAELALGNEVSSDDIGALRHIAVCKRCREELSLMTRVVTAARSVEEPDLPADPPQRVWQRITRELAGTDGAVPSPPASSRRGLPAVPAGSRHASRSPGGSRRKRRLVCGLLTGVLIVWWRSRRRSAGLPASPSEAHRVRTDRPVETKPSAWACSALLVRRLSARPDGASRTRPHRAAGRSGHRG